MFEWLRIVRDAFPMDSPWYFVGSMGIVGFLFFGGAAYLYDASQRTAEAKRAAEPPLRVTSVPPQPSEQERVARRQLRNGLADLIAQGRMHHVNLLRFSRREMPMQEEFIVGTLQGVSQWHFEVIRFTHRQIGSAEAMLAGMPPPSETYPPNLQGTFTVGEKHGGYDFRQSWDRVVGGLAVLQQLLDARPAL